jgi:hypothetical protein
MEDVTDLNLAVYELASLSRRMRVGLIATFRGAELYAFPHMRTETIIKLWRMAVADQARRNSPAGSELVPITDAAIELRWTVGRKADLLERIEAGTISEAHAQAAYGISDAELVEWRADASVSAQRAPVRLQAGGAR